VIPVQFLLDTSALIRLLRDAAVRARWDQQITAGLVAVCPVVELEVLYTARSKADRSKLVNLLETAFAWVAVPDRAFDRAGAVQEALTAHGAHRSAGTVDLLVAATADLHGLTLVHYDRDFDQISKITGQAAAWLAPPGSIT
jgi:hypothetical protein